MKKNAVIFDSRADDVVAFVDSLELIADSGLPASALIEVGNDHRLADPEPLQAMLEACERQYNTPTDPRNKKEPLNGILRRRDQRRRKPPVFFARMEYIGDKHFALSCMRHNGEWVGVYDALSVDECMKAIQHDSWFHP